jgi:DNA-binding winged helix-turn-helix (wHTH) protein/TolB-like protein
LKSQKTGILELNFLDREFLAQLPSSAKTLPSVRSPKFHRVYSSLSTLSFIPRWVTTTGSEDENATVLWRAQVSYNPIPEVFYFIGCGRDHSGSVWKSLVELPKEILKISFLMVMGTSVKHLYEFGPFQLDPPERLLLCDGQPVPMTPKAFDLLVVLVERGGHLVEKGELLKTVWRDSVVEEGNLSVTVSFLRKALNDDRELHKYIETVSKRGYRFVAGVKEIGELESPFRLQSLEQASETGEHGVAPEQLPQATPPPATARKRILLLNIAIAVLFLGALVASVKFAPRPDVGAGQVQGTVEIRSLAVLPFQMLGAKGRDEYLGLGMADALITRLGNTGKIIVRPTSAIQRYNGKEPNPQAAGQEQGVDAVLDGRIQREPDRVRLTVQLIRVRDGVPLWGETFDREFTNIFALEDALSERVAQSIRLKLTGEETRRFTKRSTERPDAYEAYVKGGYFWNKRTDKGMKKGLEYFQQAIALDPTFAEAYVGVADSYATLGLYAVIPPREAFPAAKEATKRALEMDDGLAEAHATLGFINFYYDWNGVDAGNEFRRALADNPNYAMAHSWYGESLAAMGRYPEAVAEAQRAQEDDPLSLIIGSNAGWTLSLAGKTDQAIEILRKAIEIDPSFPRTHFRLGRAYEQKKSYEMAIAELEQAVSLSGGDACYKGSLGHAYAISGKTDLARQVLQELEGHSGEKYVPAYAIALVYSGLGENDHALSWLQKAYEDRSTSMVFVKIDPEFNSLRSDPRFQKLSRQINF